MRIETPPEVDPRFVAALLGEDELGVVVRSHIFVEANINRYLELVVSAPEQLRGMGLRYRQRVQLACALGFDPDYQDALVALGEIRNAFSHKLDTQLTSTVVDGLFAKLPPQGKRAVELSYEGTKAQLKAEGKLTLHDLAPREKFILITLSLERLVMAAVLLVTPPERNAV